jgi:hypothetical protein
MEEASVLALLADEGIGGGVNPKDNKSFLLFNPCSLESIFSHNKTKVSKKTVKKTSKKCQQKSIFTNLLLHHVEKFWKVQGAGSIFVCDCDQFL